jgi:hypothetical protein
MAQWNLTGGGIWKWGVDAAARFSWDGDAFITGTGIGVQSSVMGFFTITMPTSGAVNVLGAGARNWSATGIAINYTESLYYELPHGTDGSSVPGNFWIAGAEAGPDFFIGHDWVMIATRPYTTSGTAIRIGLGVVLATGQSWNSQDGFLGQSDGLLKFTTADVFSGFLVDGILFTSGASRTANAMSAGHAYVLGVRITKASLTKTFTASRDTYVDLSNLGALAYVVVTNGAAEPGVTANSLRLEKVVTDANNVTSVTTLAPIYPGANFSTVTATALTIGGSAAVVTTDSRLSDARTPLAHDNTKHSATYITAAGVTDALITTSDITTNNVDTTKHGFMPKLPGGTTTYYRADGTFAAPGASSLPTGQDVLDFGATPTDYSEKLVTGLSGLTTNSLLAAFIEAHDTTADNSAQMHKQLAIFCPNPICAYVSATSMLVSFPLLMAQTQGTYLFHYATA